jgi:glycosyltransferase involved in cell wall biosynthesis
LTPRVLFVGRGRLTLPLAPWLAKKWDALDKVLDLRVLNAGSGTGDPRFQVLPHGAAAFYPRLAFEIARVLRGFPADVIVASDPYVGAAALAGRSRSRRRAPKVIVEVHGDPRTFTRGYGSPARRVVSPATDAIARYSLRHADGTRALSQFTSSLIESVRAVPATASFPTYSDLSAFADPPRVPVPEELRLVFVGALEQYKNVDGLAAAWRRIGREVPGATLVVVGNGSRRQVIDRLAAEMPGRVEHHPELLPREVAAEIDHARALILPSWPEGLGRVVLEAFARGRTTVATNAGGIRDIVTNGRDGILIPVADTDALVDGMLLVLQDHDLAVRLGAAARVTYEPWHQTAADFAAAYRRLVDLVLAGAR